MAYSNDLTVREARALYFKNSGFDERTYTDRWVKLPVLGRTIYLPNIEPRRKAVPLHDIDHVLTEYKTNWLGEWEISSYELGTGCGKYWAGWLINMQAILAGAIRAPSACVKAFARGRRSEGVYHLQSADSILDEKLGSLRQKTTLSDDAVPATPIDIILFYSWFLGSVVLHITPILIVGIVIAELLK